MTKSKETEAEPTQEMVKVRINKRLWGMKSFTSNGTKYEHGTVYKVSQAEYEKLSAHKTTHFGNKVQVLVKA